jgi:hypothetical protein
MTFLIFDSKRSGLFLQNDFFEKAVKATEIIDSRKGRITFKNKGCLDMKFFYKGLKKVWKGQVKKFF